MIEAEVIDLAYSSNDDDEFYVEDIRQWRYNKRKKKLEYFIKWKNYDEGTNTWEPEEHLKCQHILDSFLASLSKEDRENLERAKTNPQELNGFQRHATYLKLKSANQEPEITRASNQNGIVERFHLLVSFEDTNKPERLSVAEMFDHEPDDLLDFMEKRILIRSDYNENRGTVGASNGKTDLLQI